MIFCWHKATYRHIAKRIAALRYGGHGVAVREARRLHARQVARQRGVGLAR